MSETVQYYFYGLLMMSGALYHIVSNLLNNLLCNDPRSFISKVVQDEDINNDY